EFGAFGKITEDLTKTVTIGNVGAAPMVVTMTAPAGFELSATTLEVAPHAEETFTITAKASTAGIFSGNLTVVNGEYQTVDIPVTAIVLDPSKFFENFSGNAGTKNLPQGWIEINGKTQWAKTDFTSSSSNNFVHNSTYSTLSILATPLLKVEEGEKMVFDAARKASSSSAGMGVNVYYSADRQNWTLVKEVPASEMQYFAQTQSAPTSQKWTTFTVDGVPAGNYYIGFESGYCSIDDVYGFERVAVDHDVVVKTKEIAKTADVNSEYFANVTLYNLNATAEAEDAYTVSVAFNGEEVAEVESLAIPAEGTAKFEFSFTPHAAGVFPLDVTYTWADGYSILVTDTVTVRAESASLAYTVGDFVSTNNATPLYLNYKNSVTETLYTAEQLTAAGIKAGDKITSLSYNGYNNAGELTSHVKTFVMNCEDTEFGAADMTADEDMTLVFDADVTFAKKGLSSATELMLQVAFNEPFIYTGGALRIKMQSEADSFKNVYFEYDNVPAQCYGQKSDSQKVDQFTSYSECKFPVTTFGVELTPEALTGKVVDQNGNALEGVSIVLTAQAAPAVEGMMAAPVVQYSTTTDENGEFELPIIQTDKTYTAVFSKDGYENYETELQAPFGAIDNVVLTSTVTGINDLKVKATKAIKVIENGEVIIIKDGVRYNVMGQKK
ncbi:MAG: carboxypeptidase regulatory-like domain-containing protein, partial [Bacteroidales bacterium]|nr:carboxypeptidase regulatory-like domain-containing protein [Candidatus Sodaliphilus limicaballi]